MLDEREHELERVRGYRADMPEPDDATVAAARLELMEAIGSAPRVPASRGRGRSTAPRSRTRLAKLQRRRRFALAGGLATVGVGVAGALGFTTAATPVSALAAQMNQLAKVAANQDWTGVPGPGQYIYTESDNQYDTDDGPQNCTISSLDHRKIWIATDGSGAIDETLSDPQFTSAADQQHCDAAGITDPATLIKGASGGERFPTGGLSLPTNDWQSLSTDPQTLLTEVHASDGGPDTPAELFTNVADFMRESDVPPVIRSTLYKATALIPGVRLLGPATTHDGQSGLGVAFYADGEPTHALIFDQTNGRMLGELYYDKSGNVTSWADYTQQAIVDSVPNYPMTGLATVGSSTSSTSSTTTTSSGAASPPAETTTTSGTTTSGATTTSG
jgi:hypothetical protein